MTAHTPPKGFDPFSLLDAGGFNEKRFHFSHRRKVRNGWDYWTADNPRQFVREVWIGYAARSITTHQVRIMLKQGAIK